MNMVGGGGFSRRVESNVGKGEIARYKQFFLCPLCFEKICTKDALQTYKNKGFFGKGLKFDFNPNQKKEEKQLPLHM